MDPDPMIRPHVLRNALDVCIIGAGPAGLSAALALGRVLRSAVVFDSGEYRGHASVNTAPHPTHDDDNPALIRNGMMAELRRKYRTISFANTSATAVREVGPVFEVDDATGRTWKGRKLILATGCSNVFPDTAGYEECWGKGVFNCLFARGFEQSGVGNAAVLIATGSESEFAHTICYGQLARQFARDMSILTNGLAHLDSNDMTKTAQAHGFKLDDRKIKRLVPSDSHHKTSVRVEFEDGSSASFGFLFHKPPTVVGGDFAEHLGLKMTTSGDIETLSPTQETSVRGVFAAGDCATPVKQVAVAMGAGVAAGVGANAQILQDDFVQGWW